MYLHLGENYLIPTKEVVLIGSFETALESDITKEFFEVAEEEGFVVDYSMGNPRSFVLTSETIYLSMISSSTLEKRMKNLPVKLGEFNDG
ncbi:extracellular matrix regulator RemB [Natronospora cellulosivora (SeqCode)]